MDKIKILKNVIIQGKIRKHRLNYKKFIIEDINYKRENEIIINGDL